MKRKAGPSIAAAVVIFGALSGAELARAQSQPNTPVITFVGDSASYSGFIAVGELVTLFGTNLSDGGTYQAQGVLLPTRLGTTQVVSYGAPLELLYVSPTQINLLMSTSGPPQNCPTAGGQGVDLTVTVGGASSAAWDNGYATYAPALFLSGFDCPYLGWPNAGATNVACGLSPIQKPGQFPRPIVTDLNYSLVTNQNPAQPGQTYVLWLTGLGNPGYTGDLRSQFPTLRIELSRCCLPAYFKRSRGRCQRSLRRCRQRISRPLPDELHLAAVLAVNRAGHSLRRRPSNRALVIGCGERSIGGWRWHRLQLRVGSAVRQRN